MAWRCKFFSLQLFIKESCSRSKLITVNGMQSAWNSRNLENRSALAVDEGIFPFPKPGEPLIRYLYIFSLTRRPLFIAETAFKSKMKYCLSVYIFTDNCSLSHQQFLVFYQLTHFPVLCGRGQLFNFLVVVLQGSDTIFRY